MLASGGTETARRFDRAAAAGLFVALLLAFYVGFGMPNPWSMNYYIPGVLDGFYRRSLLGTLLSPLGSLRFHDGFLAVLQILIRCSLVGLLIGRALRSPPGMKLVVILFLLAPTGGYLFNTSGYVEDVLFLILLAALGLGGGIAALGLMAASLFVHEMAAFTVIPLYLANLVRQGRYRTVIVQGVVLLGVFAAIYFFLWTATPEVIESLLRRLQATASKAVQASYYYDEVFGGASVGGRIKNYYDWSEQRAGLTVAGLGALAVAAGFLRRDTPIAGLCTALCIAGACVAPLLLGFFGYDVYRWMFLSISSSLFVLLVFERKAAWPVPLAFGATLLLFMVKGRLVYFEEVVARPLLPYPHLVDFLTADLPRLVHTALAP